MAVGLYGTLAFLSNGAERLFLSPIVMTRVCEVLNYTVAKIVGKAGSVSAGAHVAVLGKLHSFRVA